MDFYEEMNYNIYVQIQKLNFEMILIDISRIFCYNYSYNKSAVYTVLRAEPCVPGPSLGGETPRHFLWRNYYERTEYICG